jgi:restriction endonuclease S subunit
MKKGWVVKPMGELCSIKNGKSNSEDAVDDAPYAFFDRSKKIKRSTKYLFDCEALIIPGEGAEFLPRQYSGKFDLHQRAYALYDFKNEIDLKYLYYFLIHEKDYFPRVAVGATVKSLRLRHFEDLPVLHPSLPEQQRIVGKLDAAFASLAEAQAHVERNRANARELFESYLNGVFEGKGDGWVERLLSDFIEVKHGYAYDGKYFEKGGPSDHPILLTPGNFSEEGKLVFTGKNTTRTSEASPDEYHFEINDLAIVMTDLSSKMKILGKAAFIRERGILHNQRIGKVISRDPDILNEYLYYFFLTDAFLANIKLTATGTMVRHTAPKRITANKIPLPPNKRDQQRIVSQLDQLRKETATLETTYQQKQSELAGLKKAVLGAAFRGEL